MRNPGMNGKVIRFFGGEVMLNGIAVVDIRRDYTKEWELWRAKLVTGEWVCYKSIRREVGHVHLDGNASRPGGAP